MFECLTGILAGVPALAPVLAKPGNRHVQNATIIAIAVEKFRPLADFAHDVAALAGAIKLLPRLAGVDEILLPGERGGRSEADRRAAGIPLARKLWQELAGLAGELGVPPPPLRR
jgi:ureidoglycolate dehydrogenase (NAD+)